MTSHPLSTCCIGILGQVGTQGVQVKDLLVKKKKKEEDFSFTF